MNGICHIEIPSKDFEKAKKFYGDLFDWKFQEMEGMDYLLYTTADGPGGGFTKNAKFASEPGIFILVEVEDIEATIKKAGEIGGQCPKGKTAISPEYGFFAELIDLEGNKIGIWGKK